MRKKGLRDLTFPLRRL